MVLVKDYINQRHNTGTHYILMRTTIEVCMGTDSMAGSTSPMQWWEWVGINLSGAW